MQIYRSIKRSLLTQGFGLENTIPSMLPLYEGLGLKGHNGWDFSLDNGDPIYWDCDTEGVVLETHIDDKGGLGVVIGSENKYKHIFWHLQEIVCHPAELLETGALIGYGDNTGMSTGPHLHRGLKETDKDYNTINRKNGYRGAIDITPFFNNIYVIDKMERLRTTLKILKAKKVNLLWAIVLALKKIVLSLKNKLI